MNKQQLSAQVATHIREAIMMGELRPSGFIRVEHLAARLGVSATPVREALMILQSEGTVRWEPRRGFRVVPVTRDDVRDLFAVQAFIAGELAARSAEILPGSEVERLRAVQHELEDAARSGDAARVDRLNHEIHRTINKAPAAHRLTAMLTMTVHHVPLGYFGRIEGWAEAAGHDHDAVFDALARRDPEAARTAMAEHVTHVGRLLLDHLSERGAFEPDPLGTVAPAETAS